MEVSDLVAEQPLISVDMIPHLHDFCRNNRSDPDCANVANRSPSCNAGGPYVVECTGSATPVTLNGRGCNDLDGDPLSYLWSGSFSGGSATGVSPAVGFASVGQSTVNLAVTDDFGGKSTCSSSVNLVDTTPPVVMSAVASRSVLWPPNHDMVPITLSVSVRDICDSHPTCRITSVKSNEPLNGLGDGDQEPDWEISGDLGLKLRSERSGTGTGRIYTITVQCSDSSGNTSSKTVTVSVPKSQG